MRSWDFCHFFFPSKKKGHFLSGTIVSIECCLVHCGTGGQCSSLPLKWMIRTLSSELESRLRRSPCLLPTCLTFLYKLVRCPFCLISDLLLDAVMPVRGLRFIPSHTESRSAHLHVLDSDYARTVDVLNTWPAASCYTSLAAWGLRGFPNICEALGHFL